MLLVMRNGREFDLQPVVDATQWAFRLTQSLDEGYAAKNTADDIVWSPITRRLENGVCLLQEMQLWQPVSSQPFGPDATLYETPDHVEGMP